MRDAAESASVRYPNWRLAAGVVLVVDRGLLMLRRARDPWAGHWEFVGGFLDPGETPEEAARRETREELSVEIGEAHLLGVYMDRYAHAHDPTVVGTANVYFWAHLAATVRPRSSEVAEVGIFDRPDPPAPLAFPRQTGAVWHDFWRKRDAGVMA